MGIATDIHLRGVPSVRILTQPEDPWADRDGTPWVTLEMNDGNEVTFYGQPGKLLALFRAIETSILEHDPDAEVSFTEDEDGEWYASKEEPF